MNKLDKGMLSIGSLTTMAATTLGLAALAGCGATDEAAKVSEGAAPATAAPAESASPAGMDSSAAPAAGEQTFSATADYVVPAGTNQITVELTVAGDKITGAKATYNTGDEKSAQFAEAFDKEFAGTVVGQPLSTYTPATIAGASLTTKGFTAALDQIRAEAAR
ncbi:hypothetical protein [Buchananella hordeovulneris]|uniref:FMN-binding domain-containing protein n=1 Tax=Buchananella hordeovulneris TaxID=52770 RepID=A0A1Q5PWG0_9ACTO|nr:hypothetical protein [Buchananella hordeovulneris]MDO5081471.1 hypothetical protein [Buchananella hordeovulneris]OKL51779.1 hypothetical protein BSZ40_06415 [Buchananella hordeovulneris]